MTIEQMRGMMVTAREHLKRGRATTNSIVQQVEVAIALLDFADVLDALIEREAQREQQSEPDHK